MPGRRVTDGGEEEHARSAVAARASVRLEEAAADVAAVVAAGKEMLCSGCKEAWRPAREAMSSPAAVRTEEGRLVAAWAVEGAAVSCREFVAA